MPRSIPEAQDNALLAALPSQAIVALSERMLTKPVNAGEILCEPGTPLIHLVFPHDCIVSLQAILEDGRTVEEASVGREGMVGFDYFLGERRCNYHATVAISGRATWLAVTDFQDVLGNSETVHQILRHYARAFIAGLMQSIVCASVHPASQRLATWLLRAQDRTVSDHFDVTQRALANVFGLRLATISDACARLQAAGAIGQGRGTLSVIDRPSLEAQACECYERGWNRSVDLGSTEDRNRRPAYQLIS
jgi:CRP-like cAMP-binding protein